jgi:sugar (pentulose or hexulose) kinase
MVRHVAVLDIGKTNAKVAVVDLERGNELDQRTVRNQTVSARSSYPHYDIERIWRFLLDSLRLLHARYRIDAVSVTTHGATAALIGHDGKLALPVLDYEFGGPDQTRAEYNEVRPDFSETGSPALPVGLNLGAQLFWLSKTHAAEFENVASILMYPQYWAFRLTGVRANEVTSLGCHTDLWSPHKRDYSALVDRLHWRDRFAPIKPANEQLGHLSKAVVGETGLAPGTPVFAGIHDSNASLLPHLNARKEPFCVVSTGTWVIAMAIGGKARELDPERDTLINVNIYGDPVPSARFMGGREFEQMTAKGGDCFPDGDDVASVLADGVMILPSVQAGSGPFPHLPSRLVAKRNPSRREMVVAASFYLANMTAICIEMIGSAGDTIIEGPFAGNQFFLKMLQAITARSVLTTAGGTTGTSTGAAMLCGGEVPFPKYNRIDPPTDVTSWQHYAQRWRNEIR